ncbi:MAG: hypothetical protein JNJ73_15950 [Hyphomonadaceae bacterium]|nr:hypothetical protein [Hyphomonadaceae bacterium]
MSDVNSLAKRVAEGAITMIAAIQALTGFSQSEIERLMSQAETSLDRERQEQVERAERHIDAAIRSRNW